MVKVKHSAFFPVESALLEIFEHLLERFDDLAAPFDGFELSVRLNRSLHTCGSPDDLVDSHAIEVRVGHFGAVYVSVNDHDVVEVGNDGGGSQLVRSDEKFFDKLEYQIVSFIRG